MIDCAGNRFCCDSTGKYLFSEKRHGGQRKNRDRAERREDFIYLPFPPVISIRLPPAKQPLDACRSEKKSVPDRLVLPGAATGELESRGLFKRCLREGCVAVCVFAVND